VSAVARTEAELAGVAQRGTQSAQLAEMQRKRLIAGAISAIEEYGYTRTTVAHITGRARVSRRTFYELFANREDCLIAVLEETVARVGADLEASRLESLGWCERVRLGLARILAFLDSEPELARVCVVQALRGGPRVLERRERVLAQLAAVLDAGRSESGRGGSCTSLTAEGLVGAAFTIVHARLARGENEPLSSLLGELMGMIVLPYLGPAAARREQRRRAPRIAPSADQGMGVREQLENPLRDVPMRLTYRTAVVLEGVARHPGASNRAIADFAGIADQGQISKLLARLERLGLLANAGEGHAKGEPNAWQLTPRGAQLTRSIHLEIESQRRAA
jgi:AcrR family transcriptional regulator